MKEILLTNPGLVENAPDETSCYLSCIQMVMRTKNGGRVYSFDEMDDIQKRPKGCASWEFALLQHLAREGFDCVMIAAFSLARFVKEGEAYLNEFYGKEAAAYMLDHTDDLSVVIDFARQFLEYPQAKYEERVPTLDDVRKAIDEGFYIIPMINQRILQADPGVAMHSVLIYGYSNRGVRFHNPGPPSTEASEITWEMFDKAWSSPQESSRQLILMKSCEKVS